MNCLKCEKRIRSPRHDYSVAELAAMCRKHCISCNPDEMPRGGRSQVEATDYTIARRKVDPCDQVPIAENQADTDIEGVSPDAFDRLRKAMTALFALAPLDLLIVQHIFNGGRFSEVRGVIERLLRKCQKYHGSARQMVYSRKNGIIAKFPQIEAVFARQISERGGDRRRVDE